MASAASAYSTSVDDGSKWYKSSVYFRIPCTRGGRSAGGRKLMYFKAPSYENAQSRAKKEAKELHADYGYEITEELKEFPTLTTGDLALEVIGPAIALLKNGIKPCYGTYQTEIQSQLEALQKLQASILSDKVANESKLKTFSVTCTSKGYVDCTPEIFVISDTPEAATVCAKRVFDREYINATNIVVSITT